MRSLLAGSALVVSVPIVLAVPASSVAPAVTSPVLLESLTVPTDGSSVTSRTVLTNNVKYTLVAKGTFAITAGTTHNADAEYRYDALFQDDCPTSPPVDIGMSINVTSQAKQKQPVSWGAYSTSHKYETGWLGKGATIKANYHDCNLGDNHGKLTLEIWGTAT
jgi:hypothetical protein